MRHFSAKKLQKTCFCYEIIIIIYIIAVSGSLFLSRVTCDNMTCDKFGIIFKYILYNTQTIGLAIANDMFSNRKR